MSVSAPVQKTLDANKVDSLIPANTTYNVTNYAELVAALVAAINGDTINLAAGTYTGPLTIGVGVTMNGTSASIVGAIAVNSAGVALNAIDVSQATFAGTTGATITGTGGDDFIAGGPNPETINGAGGEDLIRGGGGNDILDGGTGADTLDYSDLTNAVQVNLVNGQVNAGAQGGNDTVSNFENVLLGSGNDQFIGSEGENNVDGGVGDDQIDGRGGVDTFIYNGVTAVDGMAQQIFNVLRVNSGAQGTDTIQNVEQVRFISGTDVLTIQVDALGNALVASRDDAGAMNEGDVSITRTALTGVLSNDINLDQGVGDQKIVVEVGGSSVNLGQPIVGTYGTLTLNADGSYLYVQNQAATNDLSEGEIVTDTFSYLADDGDTGTSATANLVITITGTNDVPTLGGTNTATLTEDTNVVLGNLVASGSLTITDPDHNESTYRTQNNSEAAHGAFVLNADGSWTYTVNNAQLAVQQLGAGQSLTDTFTAVSFDGSASQPITVTINGVNDNPVIGAVTFAPLTQSTYIVTASSANGTLATAIPITFGSLASDPEIYRSTVVPHVTIVASTDANPDFYSITFTNLAFSEPNMLITFDIDGVTGPVAAAITSYFNGGLIATSTTDEPFATSPAYDVIDTPLPSQQLTSSGGTLSGTLQVRVGSAASGGTAGLGLGNGYVMHISFPGASLVAGGPGNLLTETNAALSTSGNVAFTDVDLNDAPAAAYTAATGFSFNVANGPTLTLAQQTALASAFSIAPNGAFTFNTPSPDFLGHDDVLTLTYNVVVSDQHGGSATTPVTITINGSNDAPVITSAAQGATLTETNAALTASGAVTATDVDNGDVLAYSVTGTTVTYSGAGSLTGPQSTAISDAFTLNADGTWSYNLGSPDFLPAGSTVTLTETVEVSDGHGGTATQNVVVTLNGANDAPTILTNVEDTYSHTLVETNAALVSSGAVLFSDVDIGDTPLATYTAATDATVTATGLTLTAGQISDITAAFALAGAEGSGAYAFNLASPDYLAAGDVVTATFNVHVVDGHGGDTVQAVTYTIQGTNDAPELTGGSLGTVADTVAPDTFAPLTGSIADAATDVDNHDTKAFTLAGGEGGGGTETTAYGTLTLNEDGTYSFDVNSAAVNGLLTGDTVTLTFSVIVTDSGDATDTADFTITITGQNENPIFDTSPLQYDVNDNFGTVSFNLLQGASDPDNVPSPDLDIANVTWFGWSTNGDPLTNGQNSLLFNAVNSAFSPSNADGEAGTFTFDTTLFDFLDLNQSVTVELHYNVTDTNGGSSPQVAFITINGALETNFETSTPFDDFIDTHNGFPGGGQFGDYVVGNDGDDEIYTYAGADNVYGDAGDDFIDAGSGNDTVVGGEGDDTLFGGSGNDLIFGDEQGLFVGEGGPGGFITGDNTIDAGSGNDEIHGGLGNNRIAAGSGNDTIYVGSAGLPLFGGEGRAQSPDGKVQALPGGEGAIYVDLPSGFNVVDGGSGFDTVVVSGNWSDYTITRTSANTFVFERPNEDGTAEANVYTNVEYFVFAGGEGTASMLVNDRPVVANATFSTPEIGDGSTIPVDGVIVGNVGATDADIPLGDTLRYFIDGSGANNFTIDADGNLILVNPLDFEAGPRTYALGLTVVDARGAIATSTITVNVTDANDAVGPVDVTGAFTAPELATVGTVVATAAAVDPDATDTVTYSLSDDAAGRFAIDATTGVITVANSNMLDFEANPSHVVAIVATSSDATSSTTLATITLTDVSPETIVGTAAAETFVAGAGADSYTTNITTSLPDSVNLGDGLDRVTINATAPTEVRLSFTSAEVGNGQANDSNTLANQDGGLAVRVQAEDGSNGLTGSVTRTDDEGMVFIAGAGVTFDVTDLPSGVSRGNTFEVAVLGTSAADTLTAVQAARPYYFNGGSGNDTISGGTANDFLVGGAGDDTLAGGAGNNTYIGGAGIDTVDYSLAPGAIYVDLVSSLSLNGYGGNDTFISGIENVIGGNGNDIVLAASTGSLMNGGGGDDYLIGRGGNDTLIGGSGSNGLQGGTGDDTYVVSSTGDSVIEFLGEGIDTVRTTLSTYTLNANVENLVYTGAGAFTGIGNGLANSITGGTGNDTLTGGAGADVFNAIANNGLDTITDFLSGTDKIKLDGSYAHTATFEFVSGAGPQTATSTNSAFLFDTTTGILSYDADGTGSGAAVQLFNLGAGTSLLEADLVFAVGGRG